MIHEGGSQGTQGEDHGEESPSANMIAVEYIDVDGGDMNPMSHVWPHCPTLQGCQTWREINTDGCLIPTFSWSPTCGKGNVATESLPA